MFIINWIKDKWIEFKIWQDYRKKIKKLKKQAEEREQKREREKEDEFRIEYLNHRNNLTKYAFNEIAAFYGIEIGLLKSLIFLDSDGKKELSSLPNYDVAIKIIKDKKIYNNLQNTSDEFENLLLRMKNVLKCNDDEISEYKKIFKEAERERYIFYMGAFRLIIKNINEDKKTLITLVECLLTELTNIKKTHT